MDAQPTDFTLQELCKLWRIVEDEDSDADLQERLRVMINAKSPREMSETEIKEIARGK